MNSCYCEFESLMTSHQLIVLHKYRQQQPGYRILKLGLGVGGVGGGGGVWISMKYCVLSCHRIQCIVFLL